MTNFFFGYAAGMLTFLLIAYLYGRSELRKAKRPINKCDCIVVCLRPWRMDANDPTCRRLEVSMPPAK